jgi:hypothetical protein
MFKLLVFIAAIPLIASAVSPKLFISPAPVFDMDCQRRTGFKVEESWFTELQAKKDQFQSAWDAKANSLNVTSESLAKRKFSRAEYSVALILCKWTPMGHPFIVSARPFLKSSASADPSIKDPLSMTAYVSMTHHELLHSLLDNIETLEFSSASTMLQKYNKEHFNVLVHLHLIALQKAIYEKLGESELLKQTEVLYRFIGGDYLRVWEIIQTEGTDVFLRELQAYNSKKP